MAFRFSGMRNSEKRTRVPFLDGPRRFFRRLPPSDRAIAGFLGIVFVLTCLVGLVAFERTFLIEVPARGGTLSEGEVGSPRFVNPLLALTDADRDLSALTYAGLMGNSPDGPVPVIAESYMVSPDGKIYTFTIRKGAKFSDGSAITADDVVYTVSKAQDPALKSPELANWSNIRAEALDARTVRFTLPKAYAPFLADTTLGILPAHLWKSVSDDQFPFSPLMTKPVGAGPFKITQVSRTKTGSISGVELSGNGNYALGRPYLSGMKFSYYANTDDLTTAYKNHSVESAYGIAVPGARVAPYSRVFGVFFNQTENKAFAQLAVRKALSISIDRDHITNGILGGYAASLIGPIPPGSGITEPALPTGDRIALAKKVLTDNGWTFASSTNTWKNAKEKLELDAVSISTSNVPELKVLASAVQADWQALGVPTSLELHDPSSLASAVIRPRTYGALYFGMVIGRDTDLFPFWDSSQIKDPGLNIALYQNRTVDQLLERVRQESDPASRLADLQKISDEIAADYPAAFTHAPDFVYALPKDVQGVELPQITTPSDRFMSVATWHRRSAFVLPFLAQFK